MLMLMGEYVAPSSLTSLRQFELGAVPGAISEASVEPKHFGFRTVFNSKSMKGKENKEKQH